MAAANYAHCVQWGTAVTGWYNYDATNLEICLESKTTGFFGIGWGGTGKDFLITWVAAGALKGGQYEGHKNVVPDATNNAVAGTGSENGGYTTGCFTRPLAGDANDYVLVPDEFVRSAYAVWSTDPAATLADSGQHGSDGSIQWKLSDPTAVPAGGGAGEEGGIFGPGGMPSPGTLMIVAAGCGAVLIAGVAWQLKKNHEQLAWQNGSMGSGPSQGYGGYSQGGYGGHGGYSSDKGNYSGQSTKYSQASSRSRSKGGRGHSHSRGSKGGSKGGSRGHHSRH